MITDKNQLCSDIIREACTDAYQRLIYPSIEREVRNDLTDTAAENAMKVFAVNLKQLLMQPPVKGKTVLALDPGYRTGCKTAVVDSTGKVLDTTVIYPTHSDKKFRSQSRLCSASSKSIMLILFQSATVLQVKKPRCSQPKQSKRLTTPFIIW